MPKKSHEIRCSVCEKGVLREKRADQDLSPLLGLNVVVCGAPALVCSHCGETTVMGDVLEQVSLDLAASILRQEKLAPDEIRYLRKLLGYRQEDLADKLGVTRATVNRWEKGGDLVDGPPAYAVRSLAFFQLRSRSPVFDDVAKTFETGETTKRKSKKTRYEFQGRNLVHAHAG
jgi:YgiT-type zinc finger domain-containing protein